MFGQAERLPREQVRVTENRDGHVLTSEEAVISEQQHGFMPRKILIQVKFASRT